MPLFNRNVDRQHTQLAYRVKYFPWCQLSPAGRELVKWKRHTYIKKAEILESIDETGEYLYIATSAYKIVWAHNNVPTEQEWNSKPENMYIRCEFRRSPAIPEMAIVLLSFSSYGPIKQGEPL